MGGIDLLIAEAVMQPVDGFSLSRSLGRRFPKLKTIFVSAYDLSDFADLTGHRKVLFKPLNPAEVLEAISEQTVEIPTAAVLPTERSPTQQEGSLEGRTIGPYRVGSQVDVTQWGRIWNAVRIASGRPVALEILEPWQSPAESRKSKFIADATAKARIRHPSMVSVYGAEETEGYTHSASERTEGKNLEALAAAGTTIGEETALSILRVISEVLSHLTETKARRALLRASDILIEPEGRPLLANIIASEGTNPPMRAEIRALATIVRSVLSGGSGPLNELLERMGGEGRAGFASWDALLKGIRQLADKAMLPLPAPAKRKQPVELPGPSEPGTDATPPEGSLIVARTAVQLPVEVKADEVSVKPSNASPVATLPTQAIPPESESVRETISLPGPPLPGTDKWRRPIALLATACVACVFALAFLRYTTSTLKDSEVMVEIPGGEFIYQDKEKLNLPTFWIDQYEVTIGQYAMFLEALKKQPSTAFDYPAQPREKKSHEPENWKTYYKAAAEHGKVGFVPIDLKTPIFLVDWYDAYAYAKWKGRRLPTEMEWEKAARGPAGSPFPWGNVFDPKKCNSSADYSDDPNARATVDGYNRWCPVDAIKADRSVYGVVGMAGNVSEWTGSYDPIAKMPVVRGGSYHSADISLLRRTLAEPGRGSDTSVFARCPMRLPRREAPF